MREVEETMRICIGSDHRGVQVKQQLVDLIERLGHEVDDIGVHTGDAVDYWA